MALRADSYSSTGEVAAFCVDILGAQPAFNTSTRPTLSQVERIIDRVSATLNVALNGAGLTTPISNTTARLDCDEWVTVQAAQKVKATRSGAGATDAQNSNAVTQVSAAAFAAEKRRGFVRLGVGVTTSLSAGLAFTGQDAKANRLDPSDPSLRQPAFLHGLFDDGEAVNYTDNIGDDEGE